MAGGQAGDDVTEPVTVVGPAVHQWIDLFIAWMAAYAEFDNYRREHPGQNPSNADFREKMDAAGRAARALGEAERAIDDDRLTDDERGAMARTQAGFAWITNRRIELLDLEPTPEGDDDALQSAASKRGRL